MSDRRLALICLLIVAAVAVGFALFWLKPVLIPLILAGLLAQALGPLIAWLGRTVRVPRGVAIVLALGLGAALFMALGGMITSSARSFAANADAYEARLESLVAAGMQWLEAHGLPSGSNILRDIPLSGMAKQAAGSAVSLFSNGFLVVICLLFLLQGVPSTPRVGGVREKVQGRVKRYLVIKVGTSGVTGLLVGLSLWIAGVDLALTFGVLTFLLNFIPSVGSIIAVVLPIPVILLSPEATWITWTLALALPGTVQGVVGNVIEPRLMGESLELHPLTVLSGLVFWGALWGIPGMFLAAPLTAVLKIVLEQSEVTAPVARMLAGHLSEAES